VLLNIRMRVRCTAVAAGCDCAIYCCVATYLPPLANYLVEDKSRDCDDSTKDDGVLSTMVVFVELLPMHRH
jgi:hypothetical protein